jgi:hypothetical protein
MKRYIKPSIALVSGPVLLAGLLCQTAQAQQTSGQSASSLSVGGSISGVTIMADEAGANYGSSEILTVDWSVGEPSSGSYVYTYTVYDPAGDVILPPNAQAGSPENVDLFDLDFNPTLVGAVTGSSSANGPGYDIGSTAFEYGIYIDAGQNSGPLVLDSDLPPTSGDASASDATPPSPWSSSPNGGYFPVPGPVSATPFTVTNNAPAGSPPGYYAPVQSNGVVPDESNTMTLLAGVLVLLPVGRMVRRKQTS